MATVSKSRNSAFRFAVTSATVMTPSMTDVFHYLYIKKFEEKISKYSHTAKECYWIAVGDV